MTIRALPVLLAIAFAHPAAADESYHNREDVRAYIADIAKEHAFDRAELERLIGGVKKQSTAIERLDAPAESKPWYEYRAHFLKQARIIQGIVFWHKNDALIREVSEHYKVPPEIIVALIGIETNYGRVTGTYPVLDTLVTLGFDYPKRAAFFRRELTQFLLLCREEKIECRNAKGSYAGAMGIGQFISSSYRAYAVDFDRDGKRDLWHSTADAVGSVANYIARHGWAPQAPVVEPVNLNNGTVEELLNRKLEPWLSLADLRHRGILTGGFEPREKSFTLLGFHTSRDQVDVWAGYHNFYVISRYNHSRKYAMAVYDLSHAIRKDRRK